MLRENDLLKNYNKPIFQQINLLKINLLKNYLFIFHRFNFSMRNSHRVEDRFNIFSCLISVIRITVNETNKLICYHNTTYVSKLQHH